jgi:hypothetical protein
MPTAAEAAAKARRTPGLCSANNFAIMNVGGMKEHLSRESSTYLQNDTKDKLIRHHKAAAANISFEAVADIIPTSNLEDGTFKNRPKMTQ